MSYYNNNKEKYEKKMFFILSSYEDITKLLCYSHFINLNFDTIEERFSIEEIKQFINFIEINYETRERVFKKLNKNIFIFLLGKHTQNDI